MDKKELDKELYETKEALTDEQLLKFCKKNKLNAEVVDEADIEKIKPTQRFYFIFTGAKDDQTNGFHGHHWLLLDRNRIFDSYGKHDYNLPKHFKYYKNQPSQLQEFNTVTCGQYCLAALTFLTENPNTFLTSFGPLFADEFGFSKDKRENDELVKTWYEENK